MKQISRGWKISALVALAAAALPTVGNAQSASIKSDDYYNLYEVGVYGGFTHYGKISDGLGSQISNGGLVGVRLTANPFEHFGFEGQYQIDSWNNLKFFTPVKGINLPEFPLHVYSGAFNALAYFTDRNSHIRPFVTIGFGAGAYSLTDDAKRRARAADPSLGLNAFNNDTAVQMNYGVGVKWQFRPRLGFRADVRGLVGPNANFGLPENPAAGTYIPKHYMQGVETTAGLSFYFGRKEKPAPPAPPPPPPPPPVVIPRHDMTGGSITASSTSVCPGEAVQLSSNASDPQGHRLSYQWSISGRNGGSNSSTFTFTPDQSGDYQIGLRVTDTASENAASAVDARGVSIHVKQYSRPTIGNVTATPADLERGGTITLHATGTGSECSGPLSYSWTASEGSVSGSGADASFNSGSVSFNEADRSRPQSKQIRFTATVSDSKGGTASGSATATVEFGAQTKHFGDIVFPKGSARVNNCGKRVLIEQLYPVLTSNSNYDVVLVGHIDAGEATPVRRKGAKARAAARALDRERVLQTAAILSGGTGTCSALDRSRIRGSWVGTAQETESLPTSCAMSTTPVKERKGAEVGDSSEAKNRRVEIWLVPKGMALPSAAKDAKDLPDAEMTKIGCPK